MLEGVADDHRGVREAIGAVFERFAKEGRNKVSKKQLLKILYLVKMDLPEESPLRQKLAYYWYRDGPMSDVVYQFHDEMEISGEIGVTEETGMYSLSDSYKGTIRSNSEMSQYLQFIIRYTRDFTDTADLVAKVYKQYSPSRFYTEYKLVFKPEFERYCKLVLARKGLQSAAVRKSILKMLRYAILEIPGSDEFFEIRTACSRYSVALHSLLETDSPLDDEMLNYYELALDLSTGIWNAFAYNTRLYEHDQYYDGHVTIWKEEYQEHISDLHAKLERFSSSVDRLHVPEEPFSKEYQKIVDRIDQDPAHKSDTLSPEDYLGIINKHAK